MFVTWQSHNDYLKFVHERKIHMDSSQRIRLQTTLAPMKEKLELLDLDGLGVYLKSIYPSIGRPAIKQAQIVRSLILFFQFCAAGKSSLSLTKWVQNTKEDELIATLIGCTTDSPPALGSYYDFIDRLWAAPQSTRYSRKQFLALNRIKSKPSQRLKKGEKAPESVKGLVGILARRLMAGKALTSNREKYLEDFFFITAVLPSIQCGIISTDGLTASGDGTAVHTHSSPYGHRPEQCHFKDDCKECFCFRHFSDPDADYGWDSDLGQYYFGYTLYHLDYHNADLAVDLPLLLRFTSAKRHDSVNVLFALDEFKRHEPGIHIQNLCLDSAHDNYPTYELLRSNHTRAFIDLNKRSKAPDPIEDITFDKNGSPRCKEDFRMVRFSYDRIKHAHKWRCPFAVRGIIPPCKCTDSDYGRTIYIKDDADFRLYPEVPRDSEEYKLVYNNRTASERINQRILNDYHLQQMRIHNRKHYSFFTMMIGICIHLDARYKQLKKQ